MTSITELLDELTDAQLDVLGREFWATLGRMREHDQGEEVVRAAMWLLEPLMVEQVRRQEAVHDLRIRFEANGHEVWVDYEDCGPERGWWAYCHCLTGEKVEGRQEFLGDGLYPTREEATTVADEHAVEHDGKWRAER